MQYFQENFSAWNDTFFIGLVVAVGIGFVYFRDLGDVSQMIIRVKRKNMACFIRNEYRLLAVGLGAMVLMILSYFLWDRGTGWLFWHVWVELFQHTDINRVGGPVNTDAVAQVSRE